MSSNKVEGVELKNIEKYSQSVNKKDEEQPKETLKKEEQNSEIINIEGLSPFSGVEAEIQEKPQNINTERITKTNEEICDSPSEKIEQKTTPNSPQVGLPSLRERNTHVSRSRNTSSAAKKQRKASYDSGKRNSFEREYTGIFSMFNPETFKSTQSEIDEDELMLSIKGQKELNIAEEETLGKYFFFFFHKQILFVEIIILNLKKDRFF